MVEKLPDVPGINFRDLVSRIMAAKGIGVPLDNILVIALGEPPDGLKIVGELRQSKRNRRWFCVHLPLGNFDWFNYKDAQRLETSSSVAYSPPACIYGTCSVKSKTILFAADFVSHEDVVLLTMDLIQILS